MSFGSCLQSANTYLHLAGCSVACKRHQIDYPSEEPARKRRKRNPPFVPRASVQNLQNRLKQRDRTCKTSLGAHFTNCAPLYSRRDVLGATFQDQFAPSSSFGQTSTSRTFAPSPKFGQTSTPTSLPYNHTPIQPAPRAPTGPWYGEPSHPPEPPRHQQSQQQSRPAHPAEPPRDQQSQQQSRPAQPPQFAQSVPNAPAPQSAHAPQPPQPEKPAQTARPAQPANPTVPAQPIQPAAAPTTPYSSKLPDQPFCGKCGRPIGANEKIRDHKWKHVTITVKERGLYDILEIFPSATNADIRRAYLKQALQHHPDKNMHQPGVAHEMFKAVKQAYDILLDEKQRAVYNKHGLDYCVNGPPREPPPEPSRPPPPRATPRPAPRSQPQQPRTSPERAVTCLGCTRTFVYHFSMLDHLENGHCRGGRGFGSDYILDRFYAGLIDGWRDRTKRIVCPGCSRRHFVISDLFSHIAHSTTCIEARNFRVGYGYTWDLLKWVEQTLHFC